jgi:hypothetical protein
MKRLCLVIFLIALVGTIGFAGDLRITIRADWMFTLRAGIEYRFGRYFGIQTDIGTNTQIVAVDICGVVYALPSESPWQVNLLLGIPNAGMPLTFGAGFVSIGGAVGIGYRLESGMGLDFRLGEGFPFFFEEGKEVIRDISFPLNLWPDLAIGISLPTRRTAVD